MKKRTIKYGGKSGILPKVRPVFKRFPLRPKTEAELAEEAKIEQGYAEGVPLPNKKGFTFHRQPVQKPVVGLQERIKRNIEDHAPSKDVDESKLSSNEIWALKRDEIRRQYLKEAYVVEAKRLEELEVLKAKLAEKQEKASKIHHTEEESEATRLTLPTIDSYLQGPIMRKRTPEEDVIIHEQRNLNRKLMELRVEEEKATDLLELYHAADKFITTEDELQEAITQAFEVDIGKFENAKLHIEDKLFGRDNAYANIQYNEGLIHDHAFGEIDGKPGLQTVKDTISGQAERLRKSAELAVNDKSPQ